MSVSSSQGGDPAEPGTAAALIRTFPAATPWRHLLPFEGWLDLRATLAEDPSLSLLGLWPEPAAGLVHAAFLDDGVPLLASTAVRGSEFPALSPARPAAARPERALRDLWDVRAVEAVDRRPLLDHGRWPVTAPLSASPVPRQGPPPQPEFLASPAPLLHQLPLGPVRPGSPHGPVHLRLHLRGETLFGLEALTGYAHRGVLAALPGLTPAEAAPLFAQLAADSAVAHGWAFAAAAEAASGTVPPPRAAALRAVLAELERAAAHLGTVAGLCAAAGLSGARNRAAALREELRQATAAGFGRRFPWDAVVPGGVATDLADPAGLRGALAGVAAALPALLDALAPLLERLARLGTVPRAAVAALAPGGPAGRAVGTGCDARLRPGYSPYDSLDLAVPVLAAGDAAARLRLLLAEMRESLRLLDALLGTLAPGELRVALPERPGEGIGLVEGPRGEVLCWVRLDAGGRVAAAFPLDPAWRHWPLLEATAPGGRLADFPLLEWSLPCPVGGVDL